MVSMFFPGVHKIISRGVEGSGQSSPAVGIEAFPKMSDQIFKDMDTKKMVFLTYSCSLSEW